MENQTLDPDAINLAKAIRQVETGGNPQARGASGEFGAYQFTPKTWQQMAPKYGVGVPLEQSSLEDQNKVAYSQIKEWKDSGMNPAQIAFMWNSGKPNPTGNIGVNKSGVKFNTPKYVDSVRQAYQTIKDGGQVAVDPNNPSSIRGTEIAPSTNYQAGSSTGTTGNPIVDIGQGVASDIGRGIANIPSSAINIGKGALSSLLHPIKTISNLGRVAAGGISEIPVISQLEEGMALGGKDNSILRGNRQAFNSATNGIKNAVTHPVQSLANEAVNNPVGLGMNISLAAQGLGGALQGISEGGEAANLANSTITDASGVERALSSTEQASALGGEAMSGELGKTAQIGQGLSDFGSKINPIRLAGQGVSYLAKKAGNLIAVPLGIETGTQAGNIQDFYNSIRKEGNAQETATRALRNSITPDELVGKARGALDEVVGQRNTTYQKMLSDLEQTTETATKDTPLEDRFISPDHVQNRLQDIVGNAESEFQQSKLINAHPEIADKILNSISPEDQIHTWDEFSQKVSGSLSPEEQQIAAPEIARTVDDMKHTESLYAQVGKDASGGYVTKPSVDTTPILDEFNNQLKGFKVGINPENGSLDFSNSSLRFDASAQKTINSIASEVEKIITGEADTTPMGVDTLKKSFGYLDSPTSGARAFTTPMYQATRKTLEQVPGYTDAMNNYSETTEWLDNTKKALSLGDNAAIETTFKKLIGGLRQNNEFRAQALKELDEATGGTLVPAISGQQLSSLTPRGLAQFGDIFAIGEAFHGVGIVPILAQLMVSSPRLVGEALRAIGIVQNKLSPIMDVLNKFVPEATGVANATNAVNKPPISAFAPPLLVNSGQSEQQALQEVSDEPNKPDIKVDENNLQITLPSGKVYKFPDINSLNNFKLEVGL